MISQNNKIFKDKILTTSNKISLKRSRNSKIMNIKVKIMIKDKKQPLNNQTEV